MNDMAHDYRASETEAALALGQMQLERGDFAAAAESFRMAARSGSIMALTMIGRMHERGWGMPADPSAAIPYFRRAAESGEPWAMFNLGDLYLAGRGIMQDPGMAYRLYAAAAGRGHGRSLNMLGMLAEAGQSPDSPDAADEYFRAGADAGDPWAQFNHARRQILAGKTEMALEWLDRVIDDGFPSCWQAMAEALRAHQDARIRLRGEEADARVRVALNIGVSMQETNDQKARSC